MATNNRIYWAVEGVSIAPQDATTFTGTSIVHGLQTMGITTTFNLEQVFEIGQLAIYENIEDVPDIEVTMEKVVDGYPLIFHLTTSGASTGTLAGRSGRKCNVLMNIYDDILDSASGTPKTEVLMSGMYLSSVTYTAPVDGNCTEAVTVVGNNKIWRSANFLLSSDMFLNNDTTGASPSGVQRRQHVVFGSDTYASQNNTILPGDIDGISSSGTNDKTGGVFAAHVQSITISADLGRDALHELGRKGPYFRYVNWPVEVSTEVEILSIQGDQVDAAEEAENTSDRSILLVLTDTTKVDCGTRNSLSNVAYGGADAGGGNATDTYSFTGFNDLTVTHDADPG